MVTDVSRAHAITVASRGRNVSGTVAENNIETTIQG